MPDASAGLAAKNAWVRMRKLLFPFSPLRWLAVYGSHLIRRNGADPALAELQRIRPYYRGTRILTGFGIALILLAFVLPFAILFVDMDVFKILLIIYACAFITVSLIGMAIQSAMDAVFAIRHERKLKFGQALQEYTSLVRSRKDLTLGYMSIKFAIDFGLSTLALSFYLPALLAAMYLMVYVTNGVLDHVDLGMTPYLGLAAVALLAAMGFIATMLLTLPATIFYGYYTEEAVRMMQEVPA